MRGTPQGAAHARDVRQAMQASYVEMMMPFVRVLRRAGVETPGDMAAEMNRLRLPTRRGGPWTAAHVRALLKRADIH